MKKICIAFLLVVTSLCALAVEKSHTIVNIDGAKYYIHTVQSGETLYALSKAYGVDEKVIIEKNPSTANGLKADERIKIPCVEKSVESVPEKKLAKTFNFHTVAQGETLYAISRKFEIPVQTIIEDNPSVDPIHLHPGDRMLIRRKEVGSENEADSKEQWENYRQKLNSVAAPGESYHLVESGETFFSLAHKFNITEEELGQMNNGLQAADLKAGAIIRVPSSPVVKEVVPEEPVVVEKPHVHFKTLDRDETLQVALMLPLAVGKEANSNFLEFYQGFLLGLSKVKSQGFSVHLQVYNTGREVAKVNEIISSNEFAKNRLIIGPVYEDVMEPVVSYAEKKQIPVVSPLANLSHTKSEVVFQVAADSDSKYDKIRNLITPEKHVTLIYGDQTDTEFEREILSLLGNHPYDKHTYKFVHPTNGSVANTAADLSPLLDNDRDNLFVVMADGEINVDRILAAITSANTNIVARGRGVPQFAVLGNARWNRYNNLDRTLFFKDHVIFISTYHAKRDSEAICSFGSAYIKAFSSLPTLYSYRGYDTAMIFVPAMYGGMAHGLENQRFQPLQTAYEFGESLPGHTHVNTNWMKVNYNSDFTITIE